MILVDTSAWVEFDRASGSDVDARLTGLITDSISIMVTEPVLMEVLAGARNDARALDLRRLLTRFTWEPVQPATDFEGAATMYRECRRSGVTPRNLTDCMIAVVAIRTDSELLCADKDFVEMSKVTALRLDPASRPR